MQADASIKVSEKTARMGVFLTNMLDAEKKELILLLRLWNVMNLGGNFDRPPK